MMILAAAPKLRGSRSSSNTCWLALSFDQRCKMGLASQQVRMEVHTSIGTFCNSVETIEIALFLKACPLLKGKVSGRYQFNEGWNMVDSKASTIRTPGNDSIKTVQLGIVKHLVENHGKAVGRSQRW